MITSTVARPFQHQSGRGALRRDCSHAGWPMRWTRRLADAMGEMSDPVEAAAAVMKRAEALLSDVRLTRIALAAANESAERTVHLTILETFERGLLAALEDVVAELKTLRGDPEGAWLRRRLEGMQWPRP